MTSTHPWTRVTEECMALGESPFWHPQEDRLYWVDIGLKRVWRLHVPSGQLEHWELPQEAGCIAPARNGGLVLALRDGIYLAASWHDTPQKLADAPYDTTRIRFNDGKCDPWGRFWVGTYVETKDRPDGALYCLHQHNTQRPALVEVTRGVMAANGLAWSPDSRSLYWADTANHQVDVYPVLNGGQWPPQVGTPMVHRRFDRKPADWSFAQKHNYGGRPDGAAVDKLGRYWVAMYEGARVVCLSPNGELLAEYPTPAQCPTMVCFGGRDLQTLYLTTARGKRPADETAHYPDSGAVFAMRVDTPGLPVNFYED